MRNLLIKILIWFERSRNWLARYEVEAHDKFEAKYGQGLIEAPGHGQAIGVFHRAGRGNKQDGL